ncbi:MAG TPA: AAA family ATPase, partial [Gemmataceae bacterium]|nr:AAA family ATPase [Gemmataceae bacterium]
MIPTHFPVYAVLQRLDGGFVLSEGLGFPEISRLSAGRGAGRDALRRNLHRLIAAEPLTALHRRFACREPAVVTGSVPLEPASSRAGWREPLPLSFSVVTWESGGAVLAFVPALEIEVVASSSEELTSQLPGEIRAALARGSALTLPRLVGLQRVLHTQIERLRIGVWLRSAKARALAEDRESERTPSVLARVATDLNREPAEPVCGLESLVAELAELLTAPAPHGVLLVGPSGVGKTAAVRELARRRDEHGLGATPFWATSGARLVAGMCGYGMWQERCGQLVREAGRSRAIVHLGSLVELMQVGKSEYNTLGVAAFLRPSLSRGELLAICECTPEQLPLVEREDPHLLAAFHQLSVTAPDAEQGRAILRYAAVNAPPFDRRTLDDATLDVLDRLHRRYAGYSAYPGRPLRFLRGLLRDRRGEKTIGPAHVLNAFTRETGLPRVLLDPAERLDLDRTRDWLAARVVGQAEAVMLVADLIATVKAGLTRPRRPIASLLFIGPTGVGKTELAKALAEFLFGTRDHLMRFDMSEFSDPLAVQRLTGGTSHEGLLTARVREQPFGVLLFDEFEKAHPLFFDLLLQVLGEGRLTDAGGRLADFTNTVVILTSNLGAESYQQGEFGFGEAADDGGARRAAAREHFTRAVEAFVRPELFNRLDRLVPFAPLEAPVIRAIAGRQLVRLEARDGIRHRGVVLTIGEGVEEHVARAGFDARYGARPLLRALERELLAPLAWELNRYRADVALTAEVTREGGSLQCSVRPRTDAAGRLLPAGSGSAALAEAAREAVELRRSVQALERCRALRQLRNELYRLEREQERFEKTRLRHLARTAQLADAPEEVRRRLEGKVRVQPRDQERMTALARLRETADRLRDLEAASAALEDRTLLVLHGVAPAAETEGESVASLRTMWEEILLTLYRRDFPEPDRVTLALFGEEAGWLVELAAAYEEAARTMSMTVELVAYVLPDRAKAGKEAVANGGPEREENAAPPQQFWRQDTLIAAASGRTPEREVLEREWVRDMGAFLAEPPARLPGMALRLRGPSAAPRFAPERGLHLLRSPRLSQPAACLVETSEARLRDYLPPLGITRRSSIGTQTRRRSYDRTKELVDDPLLGPPLPWPNRSLEGVLTEAIAAQLR